MECVAQISFSFANCLQYDLRTGPKKFKRVLPTFLSQNSKTRHDEWFSLFNEGNTLQAFAFSSSAPTICLKEFVQLCPWRKTLLHIKIQKTLAFLAKNNNTFLTSLLRSSGLLLCTIATPSLLGSTKLFDGLWIHWKICPLFQYIRRDFSRQHCRVNLDQIWIGKQKIQLFKNAGKLHIFQSRHLRYCFHPIPLFSFSVDTWAN